MEEPKLIPVEVKGRIRVLKTIMYKGAMIYLRMVDEDIFEYLLSVNNEIYSSYLIIKPRSGETKLSLDDINHSAALILSGACATIDHLLGIEPSEELKKMVEKFEGSRKAVEALGDK